MKIYINNKLIKAEILPNNTPTLDETLETFSFGLLSSKDPIKYAPMQKVKVDFKGDGTEVADFLLVSDNVETYTLNPLRYKHNITLIQNTRDLSKHLVRNSVFSQPSYLTKKSFNSLSQFGAVFAGQTHIEFANQYYTLNGKSKPLVTRNKEKITNPRLQFSFQVVQTSDISDPNNPITDYPIRTNYHYASDIIAKIPSLMDLVVADTVYLKYTDAQGNVQPLVPIKPEDLGEVAPSVYEDPQFNLNHTYRFPLIEEKFKQGFRNFEILFDSANFISADFYYDYSTNVVPYNKYPAIYFYMIQIEIVADVYYYNAYDVLDLLIKRQKKQTSISSKSNLFELPEWTDGENPAEDELYTLLTNTIAPNFIFTQFTMYECVADVFRLFDAIFTMDENRKLGIEYFNNLDSDPIPNPKFTGRNLSISEDKYINGLNSYYQDARIVETFPNNNSFANLRSVEFGVPEVNDHHFIVPHNIQSVIKCEVLVSNFVFSASAGQSAVQANGDLVIDITDYVFEQSVWSILDKGTLSTADLIAGIAKQVNTVYYTEGDNKIQVGATTQSSWGLTSGNWALYQAALTMLIKMAGYTEQKLLVDSNLMGVWGSIRMRLTYTASVDGETKVHSLINKYEGETLVDQANGAVDLNKLGLNMLGLSLKLGNPTLNATHRITTWDKRIKQGKIYEWTHNGKTTLWVANVVNYTFFNGRIQGKVSFVQNFNQVALRTQLMREKRMTNISSGLIKKSEEILTDFVYVSTGSFPGGYIGEQIHFTASWFKDFVLATFGYKAADEKIKDAFIYRADQDVAVNEYNATYIPMVVYGAGNTINFEMSFDHPMNAGNQTLAANDWAGNVIIDSNRKYYTNHIVYTDEYTSENNIKQSDGFLDEVEVLLPQTTAEYNSYFPKVTIPISTSKFLEISQFKIYKQPNEIFALNYQLAFLPVPGRENIDFITSEFVNNNAFTKDFTQSKNNIHIHFYKRKMSVIENESYDPFIELEPTRILSLNAGTYELEIEIEFNWIQASDFEKIKSWAIVNDDNKILFASNNKPLRNDYTKIYVATKKSRLD